MAVAPLGTLDGSDSLARDYLQLQPLSRTRTSARWKQLRSYSSLMRSAKLVSGPAGAKTVLVAMQGPEQKVGRLTLRILGTLVRKVCNPRGTRSASPLWPLSSDAFSAQPGSGCCARSARLGNGIRFQFVLLAPE